MSQPIKKIINLGAVLILVLSVLVLQVPTVSAIETGDLVKISDNAAVYYIAGTQRYIFPHSNVYYTWYKDFSSVKTITLAELQTYTIGGNITVRPGTKLIKIQSDPSVYAVSSGGILHKIDSEARAAALYGPEWVKRVIDVSDAFFVNYMIGSPVNSDQHPNGTLIRYEVLPDNKYLVDYTGKKRLFKDDATFALNGFVAENVIITTLNYPDGAQITEKDDVWAAPVNLLKHTEETKKVEVAQITATTNYAQIAANGQAKAIISVTLKDINGEVITDASESVSFSSDNSLGATLSTVSAKPTAGIAQTVLTAGYQTGVKEVVASLGNLSKTVQVSIVGSDVLQPGVTIMTDLSLLWPLYKNSAGANEEYTLTWVKIENVSIDYYIVEEATNNTFTQGVTQYTTTTNSITLKHSGYPSTIKYFYRVKGVHNTVEGLWSGSLNGAVVDHEIIGTDI